MSEEESFSRLPRRALRLALHLARAALFAICAFSAAIGVLALAPFATRSVVEASTGLELFAWAQPFLFTLAAAAVVATTLPRWKLGRSRAWSVMTAVALGGYAAWLLVAQPLRAAAGDGTVARVVAAFLPLVFVGFFDVLDASRRVIWTTSRGAESGRQFLAVIAAGVAVAAIFFGTALASVPGGALSSGELLSVGLTALFAQLVVGSALFIVLALARAVAAFFYRSAFWEAVFVLAGVGLACAGALVLGVLRPLGVTVGGAWTVALAAAFGSAMLVYGTAIRDRANHGAPEIDSGVDIVVTGLGAVPGNRRGRRAIAIVVTAFVIFLLALGLRSIDRNLMLQQLLVVAGWIAFAALFYRALPPRETAPDATIVWLEVCVLLLGGLLLLDRWGDRIAQWGGEGDLRRAAARWRTFDAAHRLGGGALASRDRAGHDPFYALLRELPGRIARGGSVRPPVLAPDERIGRSGERPPDIVFVAIDGLEWGADTMRAMPEVELLAREGVGFRNAFTRYGGTSAAGASIWFGGMSLGESLVEPFGDVNALEKLVRARGYRMFVSGLEARGPMLRDDERLTRVASAGSRDDICGRLDALRGALGRNAGMAEPLFAFASGSVGGETGEAAARRADTCLGKFFDSFRSGGTWDASIVIVTARRGASASREIAASLAPANLRIPLVVKLPAELGGTLRADPDAIAFNSDIVATLYYLAGQRPVRSSELLGRPLFTERLSEQLPYLRGEYLVASGEGPVYGVLLENGNRLFVVDAIESADAVFELEPGASTAPRDPGEGERRRAQAVARERLGSIAKAYGAGY